VFVLLFDSISGWHSITLLVQAVPRRQSSKRSILVCEEEVEEI